MAKFVIWITLNLKFDVKYIKTKITENPLKTTEPVKVLLCYSQNIYIHYYFI